MSPRATWSQEAGYCCRGSDGCGAVMRLPGAAQDELWSAVNRGAGQAVETVLTKLRMQPTQVGAVLWTLPCPTASDPCDTHDLAVIPELWLYFAAPAAWYVSSRPCVHGGMLAKLQVRQIPLVGVLLSYGCCRNLGLARALYRSECTSENMNKAAAHQVRCTCHS